MAEIPAPSGVFGIVLLDGQDQLPGAYVKFRSDRFNGGHSVRIGPFDNVVRAAVFYDLALLMIEGQPPQNFTEADYARHGRKRVSLLWEDTRQQLLLIAASDDERSLVAHQPYPFKDYIQ